MMTEVHPEKNKTKRKHEKQPTVCFAERFCCCSRAMMPKLTWNLFLQSLSDGGCSRNGLRSTAEQRNCGQKAYNVQKRADGLTRCLNDLLRLDSARIWPREVQLPPKHEHSSQQDILLPHTSGSVVSRLNAVGKGLAFLIISDRDINLVNGPTKLRHQSRQNPRLSSHFESGAYRQGGNRCAFSHQVPGTLHAPTRPMRSLPLFPKTEDPSP